MPALLHGGKTPVLLGTRRLLALMAQFAAHRRPGHILWHVLIDDVSQAIRHRHNCCPGLVEKGSEAEALHGAPGVQLTQQKFSCTDFLVLPDQLASA
jgi:hypothetical protein